MPHIFFERLEQRRSTQSLVPNFTGFSGTLQGQSSYSGYYSVMAPGPYGPPYGPYVGLTGPYGGMTSPLSSSPQLPTSSTWNFLNIFQNPLNQAQGGNNWSSLYQQPIGTSWQSPLPNAFSPGFSAGSSLQSPWNGAGAGKFLNVQIWSGTSGTGWPPTSMPTNNIGGSSYYGFPSNPSGDLGGLGLYNQNWWLPGQIYSVMSPFNYIGGSSYYGFPSNPYWLPMSLGLGSSMSLGLGPMSKLNTIRKNLLAFFQGKGILSNKQRERLSSPFTNKA